MSLYASVGSYDNLDEPTPFFNDRAAGYGFVITFLVSFRYLPVRMTAVVHRHGLTQRPRTRQYQLCAPRFDYMSASL